jgi:CBS domain-containing protein
METIKVKDLMVPLGEYVCISEDATLFEAVIALEEARKKYAAEKADKSSYAHRAVLICDKTNRVIGKLGHLDVLRSLEPKYSEVGDLKKVSGFGLSAEFMKVMMEKYELWKAPLEDLCHKAADVKVGSIVASPLEGETIDVDASLNQAVHQLILGHHQSLLVTSKGDVVGILRLADVFDEVGRRIKACKV